MVHMDSVRLGQASMEKKLERERKRTQKHFYEANKNMQNYHRLFLASQERYDKLVNLASSGGAGSLKVRHVFKQQYTSCIKVGSGGDLGLSREYPKKLLGSKFYSWWNCPE